MHGDGQNSAQVIQKGVLALCLLRQHILVEESRLAPLAAELRVCLVRENFWLGLL
jgi:hypothetical protein